MLTLWWSWRWVQCQEWVRARPEHVAKDENVPLSDVVHDAVVAHMKRHGTRACEPRGRPRLLHPWIAAKLLRCRDFPTNARFWTSADAANYPMKPGNGRSEGCGRKAKRRGDTLHTAHDAPLEMPDRSRAEPLHLRAAGAQAGAARARDDRPARPRRPPGGPAGPDDAAGPSARRRAARQRGPCA